MAKKNLCLVKTGIFYEFSKSGLSAPRPRLKGRLELVSNGDACDRIDFFALPL